MAALLKLSSSSNLIGTRGYSIFSLAKKRGVFSVSYLNKTDNGKIITSSLYTLSSGLGNFTNYGPHKSPYFQQNSTTLNVPETSIISNVLQTAQQTTSNEDKKTYHNQTAHKNSQIERDSKKLLLEKCVIPPLTVLTKCYDVLTLPFYAAIQQPWKKIALSNAPKAKTIDQNNKIYTSCIPQSPLHSELDFLKIDTMSALYSLAVTKYGSKRALGVREVFSEQECLDESSGKMIVKYELGEYQWKSYLEVDEIVGSLMEGFRDLGLGHGEKIAIFAETREEWFITAMVAFKLNLPIVTVFTTLSDEGVVHALSETGVRTLITSEELLGRTASILHSTPSIKQVVYMEKLKFSSWAKETPLRNGEVKVHTYSSLVEKGRSYKNQGLQSEHAGPSGSDTCIIMYTSGSTGVPKGVVLSHSNLVNGLKSSTDVTSLVGEVQKHDAYLAYLPLAHAMEIMCELMSFIQGISIGYSSPATLTDKSPGIKKGTRGDAALLRPSVLPAVPLVVERIVKGIKEKVSESGAGTEILFNYFLDYKMRWRRRGYSTPLVDRIFMTKIRDLLGGKLRYLVVGGAPLAPQTQEFIQTVLCCPLGIGYGMTETAATGAMTICHDLTVGRSGSPIRNSFFKLVSWEEGGYRVSDKPYPRGELYMGGANIALGYFNKDSSADFYTSEDGTRWVKTGDIAEVHPDGVFSIIDRKKDLVKTLRGEYVSLGKVESQLKISKFVENICVYADGTRDYTIAMIVPSRAQVEKLATDLGLHYSNYSELCETHEVHDAILNDIKSQGKILKLQNYEIPKKLIICPEPWLPQSGLVTAALKIKRNSIYNNYREEINRIYQTLS